MVRTFSRTQWLEASEAWRAGEFDRDTWYAVRRAASERGMLYPPTGTRHDDIDAPRPSQRAIVYRALDDNPSRLLAAIARSGSWREVVDELIRETKRLRDDVGEAELNSERRAEAERWRERTSAPEHLGEILQRAGKP